MAPRECRNATTGRPRTTPGRTTTHEHHGRIPDEDAVSPPIHLASAPTSVRTVMPAEWCRHTRTWMEFPVPNALFGDEGSTALDQARRAWSMIANVLVGYEPVAMMAPVEQLDMARQMLVPGVKLCPGQPQSAWLRESGPTFVHTANQGMRAVDWQFNGWGSERWLNWDVEQAVAAQLANTAGVPVVKSPLVLEGGSIQVDGQGTVLLTDTVQLDPNRNPDWTRAMVEAEVHARLGTTKAIWLPRGLASQHPVNSTGGQIDMLATFVRPGVVLVHNQPDPRHPDYAVCREVAEVLSDSTDAQGRRLSVIPMPAPRLTRESAHLPTGYSYINHYVANGAVLVGLFDDPSDGLAIGILRRVYRGRQVVGLDARDLFTFGGGIHTVTLQQPARL